MMYSSKVSETAKTTFEEVYERELVGMVRVATFLVGSQAIAEEAVQDAFVKLYSEWFNVKNPGGFLRTIVVNRCKDLLRKRVRSERHLQIVSSSSFVESEKHYLVDTLQKLSLKRRTVVVLKFYGGYPLGEISETMGLPEGTVRSNLYRGIDEMKEVLS